MSIRLKGFKKALWLATAGLLMLLVVLVALGSRRQVQGQGGNSADLIQNGGFEEMEGNLPKGWYYDQRARSKGRVSVDASNAKSGGRRLLLQPTGENRDPANFFGIGQAIPLDRVKGKKVELKAWVSGERGATAVAGLFALRSNGAIIARATAESDGSGAWLEVSAVLDAPDSSEVALVILLCQVKGTGGAAAFDDVAVRLAGATEAAAARASESKQDLHAVVEVNAGRDVRRIPRTLYGTNLEWIYDGYGVWDDKAGRLNPDLVQLTRDLNVSLLRYPGGFFADFYNWRDGIGPRDRRRRVRHYPGGPESKLNFGTDEALEFARQTGADLHLIANIITGTPEQAAEWVRYTNGSGKRGVRYWELGNENYGKDANSEYSVRGALAPAEYVKRYLAFAREMRRADPGLRLMAVGGQNYARYNVVSHANWNREILAGAGQEMDLLAVHNAYYPLAVGLDRPNVRELYRALLAAPALIRENLQTLSRQIEQYAPAGRRDSIGLAVTEWGPFFETNLKTPLVDHVKTMGSALFVASVLKTFVETPKLEVANFFKLVDNLFMGWIGQRDGRFVPKAPYLAFSMFTRHFGPVLVESRTQGPTFATEGIALIERVAGVEYLETLASRSDDGRTLYLLAINKHFDREIPASINISGFPGVRSGTVWTLTGTGIDAHTGTQMAEVPGYRYGTQAEDEAKPRFRHGGPGEVTIASRSLAKPASALEHIFPPLSVTVIELSR